MAGLRIKCLLEKRDDGKLNLIITTNHPQHLSHGVIPARIENVVNPCIEAMRFLHEYRLLWECESIIFPRFIHTRRERHFAHTEDEIFQWFMSRISSKVSVVIFKNVYLKPDEKIEVCDENKGLESIDCTEDIHCVCKVKCWQYGASCCTGHNPPGLREGEGWYGKYLVAYGILPLKVGEFNGCVFNHKETGCIIPREHRPYLCRYFKCVDIRSWKKTCICKNPECKHEFPYYEHARVKRPERGYRGYVEVCPKCQSMEHEFQKKG